MNDRWNPYEIVACAPNRKGHFTSQPPDGIPTLRSYHDVSLLCERGLVDIVILADGRRAEEDVLELARECEKKMVDFMVIPSGFQILLSCLELNTISGVPLLGVTKLPLNNPFNWALKRAIDIVGSLRWACCQCSDHCSLCTARLSGSLPGQFSIGNFVSAVAVATFTSSRFAACSLMPKVPQGPGGPRALMNEL